MPLIKSSTKNQQELLSVRAFSSSVRNLSASSSDPNQFPPSAPTKQAVDLDFELHEPPKGSDAKAGEAKSLLLCHGLFGSKQNWRSLAKAMAKKFGVPVYALDMRNHGTSPHTPDGMSYYDMALDLIKFTKDHGLKDIALVGHSMGGKAVMSFALHPELPQGVLKYLVSVDMSPARGPLSKEFAQYIDSMVEIQEEGVTSRSQADEILQKVEPELSIRQFLLTNLHRPVSDEPWRFRIPVVTIKKHLSQIGDFPFESKDRTWQGKTLFVKGENSKYLNRKNRPACEAYFPNNQQVVLPTGHWVQAEKPAEFINVLDDFFNSHNS
ncbi:unnamed protein product [Sympodiomycopsis kandeliae]